MQEDMTNEALGKNLRTIHARNTSEKDEIKLRLRKPPSYRKLKTLGQAK